MKKQQNNIKGHRPHLSFFLLTVLIVQAGAGAALGQETTHSQVLEMVQKRSEAGSPEEAQKILEQFQKEQEQKEMERNLKLAMEENERLRKYSARMIRATLKLVEENLTDGIEILKERKEKGITHFPGKDFKTDGAKRKLPAEIKEAAQNDLNNIFEQAKKFIEREQTSLKNNPPMDLEQSKNQLNNINQAIKGFLTQMEWGPQSRRILHMAQATLNLYRNRLDWNDSLPKKEHEKIGPKLAAAKTKMLNTIENLYQNYVKENFPTDLAQYPAEPSALDQLRENHEKWTRSLHGAYEDYGRNVQNLIFGLTGPFRFLLETRRKLADWEFRQNPGSQIFTGSQTGQDGILHLSPQDALNWDNKIQKIQEEMQNKAQNMFMEILAEEEGAMAKSISKKREEVDKMIQEATLTNNSLLSMYQTLERLELAQQKAAAEISSYSPKQKMADFDPALEYFLNEEKSKLKQELAQGLGEIKQKIELSSSSAKTMADLEQEFHKTKTNIVKQARKNLDTLADYKNAGKVLKAEAAETKENIRKEADMAASASQTVLKGEEKAIYLGHLNSMKEASLEYLDALLEKDLPALETMDPQEGLQKKKDIIDAISGIHNNSRKVISAFNHRLQAMTDLTELMKDYEALTSQTGAALPPLMDLGSPKSPEALLGKNLKEAHGKKVQETKEALENKVRAFYENYLKLTPDGSQAESLLVGPLFYKDLEDFKNEMKKSQISLYQDIIGALTNQMAFNLDQNQDQYRLDCDQPAYRVGTVSFDQTHLSGGNEESTLAAAQEFLAKMDKALASLELTYNKTQIFPGPKMLAFLAQGTLELNKALEKMSGNKAALEANLESFVDRFENFKELFASRHPELFPAKDLPRLKKISPRDYNGLRNFGNTCYMNSCTNSVALTSLKDLSKAGNVLTHKKGESSEAFAARLNMQKRLREVMEAIEIKNSPGFTQKALAYLEAVEKSFGRKLGPRGQQQDPEEFMTNLLDLLQAGDQDQQVKMADITTRDGKISSSYERNQFFINLPIYKKASLQENLDELLKPEVISEEEKISKTSAFLSAPKTLLIQQVRFGQNWETGELTKNRTEVPIPSTLQIPVRTKEGEGLSADSRNVTYRLKAVIVHLGGGLNSGHYITYSVEKPHEDRSKMAMVIHNNEDVYPADKEGLKRLDKDGYIVFYERIDK